MTGLDTHFAGSIPALYERLLVPLIFQPYAADMAARVARYPATRVLELAAGTGVATRALATQLPPQVEIVATDLNPAMLEIAAQVGTSRPVTWQPADASRLPFDDASFDVVACQFGVMFFPDRVACLAEVRRVLRPGGALVFNTWGAIEENAFADAVTDAVAAVFPDDPPRFLARLPHGYHDPAAIRRDLHDAGFPAPARIDIVTVTSRADTPRDPAIAYCQGTPLRNEIEARDPERLDAATDAATAELTRRFGSGPVAGPIQALVVESIA